MRRVLFPLACLLSLEPGAVARAQQVVINNGLAPPEPANVIDADFAPFVFDVFVRNVGCGVEFPYDAPCAAPGAPTRVALVEGGQVHDWLGVYDTSLLDVLGGSTYLLRAADSSQASLSAGLVGNRIEAEDGAVVRLQGTEVGEFVYASDRALLEIGAGTVGKVLPAGDSRTVMTGGTAEYLAANGFATILMQGGLVTGFVSGVFESRVLIRGGRVEGVVAGNESALLTWSGGSVGGRLMAYGDSAIVVRGSGFEVDGVPLGDGPLPVQEGTLTGTLASGEAFANGFCHDGCLDEFLVAATGVISVPEPAAGPALATAFLATGAACGFARARRAGRRRGSRPG